MNPAVSDPHVFDELQANAGADFALALVENFAEEAPRLLAGLRGAMSPRRPAPGAYNGFQDFCGR